MSLQDILFNAEMSQYFAGLPDDIKEQILKNNLKINSSNDLYVYGEELLNQRETF